MFEVSRYTDDASLLAALLERLISLDACDPAVEIVERYRLPAAPFAAQVRAAARAASLAEFLAAFPGPLREYAGWCVGRLVSPGQLGIGPEVDLQGAILCQANLAGVCLSWANLARADFCEANCPRADFCEANCPRAVFIRAHCARARFKEANCAGANFQFANCEGSDCTGADFTGASVRGATFAGARLSRRTRDLLAAGGADCSEAIVVNEMRESRKEGA